MVEFGWVSESGDEIDEDPVSSCLASFIPGGVGLGEPSEVVYHYKDILTSTRQASRWRKSMHTSSRGEFDVILPIGAFS